MDSRIGVLMVKADGRREQQEQDERRPGERIAEEPAAGLPWDEGVPGDVGGRQKEEATPGRADRESAGRRPAVGRACTRRCTRAAARSRRWDDPCTRRARAPAAHPFPKSIRATTGSA